MSLSYLYPFFNKEYTLLKKGYKQLRDTINIKLKDQVHDIQSELIIEWRALTIHLLELLLKKLNYEYLLKISMGQLLEGGTWLGERKLAFRLRNGTSPLKLNMVGVIF